MDGLTQDGILESGLLSIDDLLHLMVERGASDLHLKTGSAPMIRIDGELTPATYEILTPESVRAMIESILTDEQKAKFVAEKELDLAYSVPGLSRFRVNIYLQRGSWGSALRVIPARPLSLDELKMPPILKDLAMRPRGLVLVTGPTGSGKSTTLAAMINHINENRRCHIVTIEDPIEFLHKDKLRDLPARSRFRYPQLHDGSQARLASGPGRHSHRRNARLGDDGHRDLGR